MWFVDRDDRGTVAVEGAYLPRGSQFAVGAFARYRSAASRTASTNHPMMVFGCVIAVPTHTASEPADSAAAASAGEWMRPSATLGAVQASASCPISSRSGLGVFGRSPVYPRQRRAEDVGTRRLCSDRVVAAITSIESM